MKGGDLVDSVMTAAISSEETRFPIEIGLQDHYLTHQVPDESDGILENSDNFERRFVTRKSDVYSPLYQSLVSRNERLTQTHADFLKAQQESLLQTTALIEMKIDLSRQWFERASSNAGNNMNSS